MLKSLMGIFGSAMERYEYEQNSRAVQQAPQLRNLRPFDLLIGLTNSTGVNTLTLQAEVIEWMGDGFRDLIDRLGSDRFAPFDRVFLTFEERRSLLRSRDPKEVLPEFDVVLERELQTTFLESYAGISVWQASDEVEPPNEDLVASIQLEVIRTADTVLLEALQDPSLTAAGLGASVVGVTAQIRGFEDTGGDGGSDDNGLDVVIIVAIVVACLAFALLGVTLFLAYRRNMEQKEAYKVGTPHRSVRNSPGGQATGNDAGNVGPPENINGAPYADSDMGAPSSLGTGTEDMGGGIYPESLISEDISTSLTAYYRGGSSSAPKSGPLRNPRDLNDAASIDSMESYGYSLDGYQSSIVGGVSGDTFTGSGGGKDTSVSDVNGQFDVAPRDFQESSKDSKPEAIEM